MVEGDLTTHLLDVIAYQAGMVAFWRAQVEAVELDDLTWGVTGRSTDRRGRRLRDATTREAKPHIAYVLLDEAQAAGALLRRGRSRPGSPSGRSAWPSSRARSCRHYSGQC